LVAILLRRLVRRIPFSTNGHMTGANGQIPTIRLKIEPFMK